MNKGFFQNRMHFDELISTNTYLKENCAELSGGTVVTAERQTAGRGRQGNVWSDCGGVLKMSLLLKNPTEPLAVTLSSAIAVTRALNKLSGLNAGIKWTNDIVCQGKKLCGILCESHRIGADLYIICGIGINVSAEQKFFDASGLAYGGSLLTLSGKLIGKAAVEDEILAQLEPLLDKKTSELLEEYSALCVTLGMTVRFQKDGKEYIMRAERLDETGNLICSDENGEITVNAGEVSVRGIMGYV